MEDISIIIQARMSSSRLPGKVLKPFLGRPLLELQINLLRASQTCKHIIVATSDEPSDNPIADFCAARNLDCYRGSLENVAMRFQGAIEKYNIANFVRFCADRAFFDHRILDKAVTIFNEGNYEIVTNLLKPTFPKGQAVEILCSDVFIKAIANFSQPADYEHVTPYFYRNSSNFRIYSLENPLDLSHINLCVDSSEDAVRTEKILKLMDRPFEAYSWLEIVDLYYQVESQKN